MKLQALRKMTQGNIFNSMCIGGNDLPVQILHAGEMMDAAL
ncbi:hypothetical protein [Rhizobium leguminosarum]|nr:hypothetical protein [Rhizobium leguminosarum]